MGAQQHIHASGQIQVLTCGPTDGEVGFLSECASLIFPAPERHYPAVPAATSSRFSRQPSLANTEPEITSVVCVGPEISYIREMILAFLGSLALPGRSVLAMLARRHLASALAVFGAARKP